MHLWELAAGRWRQALLGVVVVPVLMLTGCGALHGTTQAEHSASVAAALDAGGSRFRAVRVQGDAPALDSFGSHGMTVWFERDNGVLTIEADGPLNTYFEPVRLSGRKINPDPENGGGSSVGCSKATSACAADAWVGHFIAQPMTYTAAGSDLSITAGGATVQFRRT